MSKFLKYTSIGYKPIGFFQKPGLFFINCKPPDTSFLSLKQKTFASLVQKNDDFIRLSKQICIS